MSLKIYLMGKELQVKSTFISKIFIWWKSEEIQGSKASRLYSIFILVSTYIF